MQFAPGPMSFSPAGAKRCQPASLERDPFNAHQFGKRPAVAAVMSRGKMFASPTAWNTGRHQSKMFPALDQSSADATYPLLQAYVPQDVQQRVTSQVSQGAGPVFTANDVEAILQNAEKQITSREHDKHRVALAEALSSQQRLFASLTEGTGAPQRDDDDDGYSYYS